MAHLTIDTRRWFSKYMATARYTGSGCAD